MAIRSDRHMCDPNPNHNPKHELYTSVQDSKPLEYWADTTLHMELVDKSRTESP